MKRRNIFSAFFMVMLAVALQTTILRPNVWAQQSATQLQSLSADPSAYAGDVILVRGGFYVFSQGFEAIADTLARRGVRSTMFRHRQERKIVAQTHRQSKKIWAQADRVDWPFLGRKYDHTGGKNAAVEKL